MYVHDFWGGMYLCMKVCGCTHRWVYVYVGLQELAFLAVVGISVLMMWLSSFQSYIVLFYKKSTGILCMYVYVFIFTCIYACLFVCMYVCIVCTCMDVRGSGITGISM